MSSSPERTPTPARVERAEPPPTLAREEPAEEGGPLANGRHRVFLAAGVVILVIAAVLAVRQWSLTRLRVTTDDAQVEGHVIPVLARVGGYVAAVDVEDNQSVRSGQRLVQIDPRDLRARLTQAEADVAAAEAAVGTPGHPGQAVAMLAAARAAVDQAQANAQRATSDLERYRALAARSIISRQQLEAAETGDAAALATLAGAREQVVAATAAVQAARGRLEAARAAREQAGLQLSYASIVSPVDGVASRRTVEVGQLIQPGQQVLVVVPLNDIWVVANLKETQMQGIDPGDRAEIVADSYPGRRFSGRVESLSPATGARFSLLPPDNATGNYNKVVQRIPVKIRLDRFEDPAHPLRPGMSVIARVWRRP